MAVGKTIRQRGLTLVETLMVVLVVSVAAMGIAGLVGNVFKQQSSMDATQVRAQLQVECAEQIMAVRKYYKDGFADVKTANYGPNLCGTVTNGGVTALSGYTVATVTVTDAYTGPYSGACPITDNCKLVEITQDGSEKLTFLLIDY
jgi:prepilin-type N-terminal cleavage/methylation domain-containing protein